MHCYRLMFVFRAMMVAICFSLRALADVAEARTSVAEAKVTLDYGGPLLTSVDTGYQGVDTTIFGQRFVAQVRAVLAIDPVERRQPLARVSFDEGATLRATWGREKTIAVRASSEPGSQAVFSVGAMLLPDVDVRLGLGDFVVERHYDGPMLASSVLQGGNASSLGLGARASQTFPPWGFEGTTATLSLPNLDDAARLSVAVAEPVTDGESFEGEVGIRVSANPTFRYKTTRIVFEGMDGTSTDSTTVAAVDGDFLELPVHVEGDLSAEGDVQIKPSLTLTNIPLLGDALGESPVEFTAIAVPYTTPHATMTSRSSRVHWPLPNVRVPSSDVDLGPASSGVTVIKIVPLRNTGEAEAVVEVRSSEATMEVPLGPIRIAPKQTYNLSIRVTAKNDDRMEAHLTVESSDPDSPEQDFDVIVNGSGTVAENTGAASGDEQAGGCACSLRRRGPLWQGLDLGCLVLCGWALLRLRRGAETRSR